MAKTFGGKQEYRPEANLDETPISSSELPRFFFRPVENPVPAQPSRRLLYDQLSFLNSCVLKTAYRNAAGDVNIAKRPGDSIPRLKSQSGRNRRTLSEIIVGDVKPILLFVAPGCCF
jgi:hypothetical protein